MVVNGTAAWIDGDVSSPSNAALGLELLALDLARGARAAGWGDLPASDGLPPSYPLRPDPAETAAGVGRWLLDDLAPALEDRRLRQMTKRAAALLATTARRIPPARRARTPRRPSSRWSPRSGPAVIPRCEARCSPIWHGRSSASSRWRVSTGTLRPSARGQDQARS